MARIVAGIVQQISIKVIKFGYIPASLDFKVAVAMVGSSYGWKLLNPPSQQKSSCSKQAGDGRSSEYLFFNCLIFMCLSTTPMLQA